MVVTGTARGSAPRLFASSVGSAGPVRGIRRVGLVDWPLLALTAALATAGALSVYAATRNGLQSAGRNPAAYLDRDLVNVAVGALLALPVAVIDYRTLRAYVPVGYGLVVLALVAVLSPLGSTVNGAQAWFSAGPVQLEPSEFAKIMVILAGASILAERREARDPAGIREVLLVGGVAGVPVALVLAEPALGTAIMLCVLLLGVLVAGDAPIRWVATGLVAAVIGGALVFSLHLLKPYQEQRFTAFTHPGVNTGSTGYHTEQSEIAVGSGGLHGQGFLQGQQTNGGFVPEQQTDFIFTVAAEESGFAGAGALLILYALLLWRGLRIAERAPDLFGRTVATGVVVWFAVQAFINVGMTLGIMPVTGLPLPFISYGGSAIFADLIGVGLLLNISHRSATL